MDKQESLDQLFTAAATRCNGVSDLLDSFFSFLDRKTDFYVVIPEGTASASMGFKSGAAESLVMTSMRKRKYRVLQQESSVQSQSVSSSSHSTKAAHAAASSQSSSSSSSSRSTEPSVRLTSEGKQIPVGNGGATDRYYWTQTLTDVTVYVDVPNGTTSKDVSWSLEPNKISLKVSDLYFAS